MTLFLLSYLGGALTIVSPCILPVLPFVFAGASRPFLRSGLPLLAGLALTFALVATAAALGGGWVVAANQFGRIAALILLGVFGLALLWPRLADAIARPFVRLGGRLAERAGGEGGIGGSLVLGIATGLLWTPCAGPILGLILTGAALHGANAWTSLLLLAYACGAATSLALALLVGGKAFAAMRRSLGFGEWIRRGLGVLVLAGVLVIALGLDTGFLADVSLASTASLEQGLMDRFGPPSQDSSGKPGSAAVMTGGGAVMKANARPAAALPVEGGLPPLTGVVQWLNSPPLTPESLRGKVVLVDFWTYSCINCLRESPYIEAWAEKYKSQGLVVIGVHSPEFAFEKNVDNVRKAVADLKITYPVAIDNDYAVWQSFANEYWPALYFIDSQGRIRHHHFGEGDYAESERVIQQLLAEAGRTDVSSGIVDVSATGAEAPADDGDDDSPETYIGYERAENFISPGGAVHDRSHLYTASPEGLNQWGLSGEWTVRDERASLDGKDGGIVYRFHARDLHLVLGPAPDGKPVRFVITIDGKPPADSHGVDVDAAGRGTITGQRLYQLVRQTGPIADHTFEIRFLDPGAQAYAFTFG